MTTITPTISPTLQPVPTHAKPQKPPVSDADHDGDNDATESKLVKSKETAASANPNLGKNINTIA